MHIFVSQGRSLKWFDKFQGNIVLFKGRFWAIWQDDRYDHKKSDSFIIKPNNEARDVSPHVIDKT